MPSILGANTLSGGYNVANSCRFDRASSASLNRAMSDGSSIKSTFSAWVKVDGTGNEMNIMSHFEDTNNVFSIVTSGSAVYVNDYNSGYTLQLNTTRIMRDPSAWFHLCVIIDRSQGTASSRNRIFINGTEETSFSQSTNYGQQTSGSHQDAISMNDGDCTLYIGQLGNGNQYFGGYLADVVYLDGTASAVTNFGEFDENTPTIWKPINVSGLSSSKGTNGFYLDFKTSDTLGNDAFGGTDFSNNNLAATDQSTDTCTNNFATMNPLAKGPDITISEGNLKVSNGNSDNSILGTMGLANGKFYWEAKCTGQTSYANIGVTLASADGTTHSTVDAGRVVYSHNGYVYKEGLSGQSNVSGLATFTTNDIISVAYDGENGSVKFYKNGTLINTTTDSDLEFSTNEYITSIGINQGGFELNFGSPPYSISSGNSDANGHGNFEYAVPSGYFALCTKNLAEHG